MDVRSRWLASLLAVVIATVGSPFSAFAADEGWFDSNERAPAASSESATPPSSPSGQEPLAPSPLLEDETRQGPDPVDESPEALTKWQPYLDPYGRWVDDPRYGRVWVPNTGVVGPGFQPYVSNGRWAVGEDGEWIWVSDYPFGWVVFHYGRWVWIGGTGWAWVPGLRYAPAWVVWRVPTGSYAYVGWAPMPPSFVWFGGIAVHYHYGPYYPWVFCPSPYLFHHRVHYYVVRDAYWVGYAARYTRPYVPGSPRPRPGARPPASRRSPSFDAARVPAYAVPRERARPYARDTRTLRDTRVESPEGAAGARPTTRRLDAKPAPERAVRPAREARPARPATRRTLKESSPSRARPDVRAAPRARPERR